MFAYFYHVAIWAVISDIEPNSNDVLITSASIVEWVGISTLLTVDDDVLVVVVSSALTTCNMCQHAWQIFWSNIKNFSLINAHLLAWSRERLSDLFWLVLCFKSHHSALRFCDRLVQHAQTQVLFAKWILQAIQNCGTSHSIFFQIFVAN